jgi:WD40 repeat protein
MELVGCTVAATGPADSCPPGFLPCGFDFPASSPSVVVGIRKPKGTATTLRLVPKSTVHALAYRPHTDLLAAACDDRVFLCPLPSPQPPRILRGHQYTVRCLAFSPVGDRLATGGEDKTIIVWDATTAKELSRTEAHDHIVPWRAYAPDGRTLVSGSVDLTAKAWGAVTMAPNRHAVGARQLPDRRGLHHGQPLATTGWDKIIRVWDPQIWQERSALDGHRRAVHCLTFSHDGKTPASGSADQTVGRWRTRHELYSPMQ